MQDKKLREIEYLKQLNIKVTHHIQVQKCTNISLKKISQNFNKKTILFVQVFKQ